MGYASDRPARVEKEDAMKTILAVSIMSLGLVTGALGRTPDVLSPSTPYASSAPITAPDWNLPSPCNMGRLELLASSTMGLVLQSNADENDGAQPVDFKCAGNTQPRNPAVGPTTTHPSGK
jgi:hypothetical protein